MALKLNIRWQLALVSVALSLLPIAIVGIFAYQIARGALEERIRMNLETLAVQSDEKLDSSFSSLCTARVSRASADALFERAARNLRTRRGPPTMAIGSSDNATDTSASSTRILSFNATPPVTHHPFGPRRDSLVNF